MLQGLSLEGKLGYLSLNTEKSLYFVNTPECRNLATSKPCPTIVPYERLHLAANNTFHARGLQPLRFLFPKLARCENFQPDSYVELFEGLQRSSYEVQEVTIRRINQMLPFGFIYIHTSPCQCAIQTAVEIAQQLDNEHITAMVRVDDRISSSCFPNLADRIVVLQSMLAYLDTLEPFSASLWRFLDRTWLDQRLYTLESDVAPDDSLAMSNTTEIFSGDNFPGPFAGLIIVGEVDFCTSLLQAEPFPWTPRFPRACEIYEITRIHTEYRRKYVGRFVARPPIINPNVTLPQQQASEAPNPDIERPKSQPGKRSASPLTPGTGKRPVTQLVTSDRGSVASDSLYG